MAAGSWLAVAPFPQRQPSAQGPASRALCRPPAGAQGVARLRAAETAFFAPGGLPSNRVELTAGVRQRLRRRK